MNESHGSGAANPGDRLIVVSNREPYIHKRSGLRISVETPAGGLSAALDDVLQTTQGTWIAWGSGNADRDTVDGHGRLRVPPENPRYTLRRVWLAPQVVDNYYHGYANQVLWPLCHITLDRVSYRRNYWEYYVRANRGFADAALEELKGRDIVWIQDFHLCLVPAMLRERSAELTIAHFWHIPWPNWSVFRVCPQARELVEALLANDLIGFQIPLFVRNFMECVRESLDADIDYQRKTITYRGRTTRLEAFPISVDFDKFNGLATSAYAAKVIDAVRKKYRLQDVLVGIGVDRLEYTKALLKRLQALELFFERYASLRRKFTFLQIAVPTRMREPYLSYGLIVKEMIERINKRFGQGTWKPIIYLTEKIDHKDLAAYYRLADLAVISSVYDGMNLVAKEYISCQADGEGVLILSELAGAADELEGSLLVNPYDIEAFSERIKQALAMDSGEKKARMISLRRQVREHDIRRWVADVLGYAMKIRDARQREHRHLFKHQVEVLDRIGMSDVKLFLDFDGTIAPIAEAPDRVIVPLQIRSALEQIAAIGPLAVISGRALGDLRERLGISGIIYAGNHGAEIMIGDAVLRDSGTDETAASLRSFLDALRSGMGGIPGVLIEDKGITASVHFRAVDPSREGEVLRVFWELARDYSRAFRITTGKKVIEIRPQTAWNKGDAVRRILEHWGGNVVPLYVGDDTTDEDAYRAIRGKGISVSIGGNAEADYYLQSQEEMGPFLDWLGGVLRIRTGR
ncbi:MAG: bifunctional alpha,alpha-trehalose-phosphate synthase (UDP-forming)/trehalose-phosphatase [Nitrospirota bacterium]